MEEAAVIALMAFLPPARWLITATVRLPSGAGNRNRWSRPPHMHIGAVFPQTEIGADAGAVRAYALRVEELGYLHLLAYDHVLGADPAVHEGWSGPYDLRSTFHEPLVLFGYVAAITSLELVTGVIILPQRQTALVAKQAAEVDLLCGGRLRLGIGVGWNHVEYEALGKDFSDRGRRSEEQVGLLRRLWTEPAVTHDGVHERVTGAGLAPLPVQRPIPIWFGGSSPPAYRRTGRLGDGWFPQVPPGPRLDEARLAVEQAARDAGRDPAALGMEGRVSWGSGGVEQLSEHAGRWRDAGASHLSVNTMGAGLATVDDHLAALEAAAEALDLTPA
jgi:probable F420-dependent oxidoreductase